MQPKSLALARLYLFLTLPWTGALIGCGATTPASKIESP